MKSVSSLFDKFEDIYDIYYILVVRVKYFVKKYCTFIEI